MSAKLKEWEVVLRRPGAAPQTFTVWTATAKAAREASACSEECPIEQVGSARWISS